jgi:hypothetical protein
MYTEKFSKKTEFYKEFWNEKESAMAPTVESDCALLTTVQNRIPYYRKNKTKNTTCYNLSLKGQAEEKVCFSVFQ